MKSPPDLENPSLGQKTLSLSTSKSDLVPLTLETELADATGRSEGISSPVLREKAWQGIGSFGAALEAELSRVAGWQKAKWESNKGWVKAQLGVGESSSVGFGESSSYQRAENGNDLKRLSSVGSRLTSRGGSPDSR